MKRKPFGKVAPKLYKTSISIPEVLAKYAEERCLAEGFTSFSAYVSDLIRRDKEFRAGQPPVGNQRRHYEMNEPKELPGASAE